MSSSEAAQKAAKAKALEEFGKNSKSIYEQLINEINQGNTDAIVDQIQSLSPEELELLLQHTQPYKSLGTASNERQVLASVSNLRERYLKKFITTGMVSYLYQMEREYTVTDDELIDPPNQDDFMEESPVEQVELNYNKFYNDELRKFFKEKNPNEDDSKLLAQDIEAQLTESELIDIATNATNAINEILAPRKAINQSKYCEALERACMEQTREEQKIIKKFLNKLFHYDPALHVQEGLQPNVHGDVERGSVDEYEHIPPNDTHCQFNSYMTINYEKIRRATLDIYNVKPDLEHAIIVYDVLDSQKDVDAWMAKYGASATYDVVSFPLNCWTLQGSFKENRERVDFYNKNNAIIKSMLDQQEKDAALGEELMKKRIRTKKVRAERIFGKDSPEFAKYRQMNPNELETKYGITMTEVDEGIKIVKETTIDLDTGKAVTTDAEGIPTNALEVPVTSINAETGETSQSRFFTASTDA